ncbi:MAG TPA: hypothetical protein VNF05_05385 [Acidimicrobiales bacterium]|nr:hypothetical protein [Acidimicrobiales bacterium]
MGLLKTLLKLMFLLMLGAVVAGVVYFVKRPKDDTPISFDEWPSVPRNPEA